MKKIFLLFLAHSLALSAIPIPFSKHFHYTEQTGNVTLNTTWVFKEKAQETHVSGSNEISKTSIKWGPSTEFLSYEYNSTQENQEFSIERKKNVLEVKGKLDGQLVQKKYNIGSDHWIQNLGFGLKEFAKSNQNSYKFVKVSPKDFDLVEMVAKKDEIETLTIQNKTYKAQKILLTLTGFRSMFWKAELWYDSETHEFLKYIGNSGPGTEDTIITLKNQ
jgi:hypothetical protein